jgi:hypothetical protein
MTIKFSTNSATVALSLLKTAGVQPNVVFNQKKANVTAQAQSQEDALLAKLSPEERKKFEQTQDSLRQTLQQLKSSTKNANAERKAAAAQKIAQIKAQLQILRAMAAVDPKGAARRAAQLSRELASAVRDYAGASGGDSSVAAAGGATATTAVSSSSATPTDNANKETAADTGDAGTTAATSSATTTVPSSDVTKAEQEKVQREKFQEDLNARIADNEKKAGAARADDEFKKSVREIAHALRSIIEQGKRRAREDKDDSGAFRLDVQAGENALGDVENALNALVSLPVSEDSGVPASVQTGVDITV